MNMAFFFTDPNVYLNIDLDLDIKLNLYLHLHVDQDHNFYFDPELGLAPNLKIDSNFFLTLTWVFRWTLTLKFSST